MTSTLGLPEACASQVDPALQRLRTVTALARATHDLDHSVTALLDEIRDVFRTEIATLLLASPAGLQVAASCGLADQVGAEIPFEKDADLLVRLAAATEPLTTLDLGDGVLGASLRARGVYSLLGARMTVAEQLLGVLFVGRVEPEPFDEEDAALMALVTDLVAFAVDRARLLQAEHQARTEAEGERRNLAFLAEATRTLYRSLDLEDTLDALARLAVPYLADWCAIHVLEPNGTIRRAAVASMASDEKVVLTCLEDDISNVPAPMDGLAEVIRLRRPVRYERLSADLLRQIAPEMSELEVGRRVGVASGAVVPLEARDRSVGAIAFLRTAPNRPFTDREISLAEELGRRAGLAVENARLFDTTRAAERRQRQLAETLQASLLPPHLPKLPGVELAAVYHPAGSGAEIGGDFYDIFHTRGRDWALIMGDVRGKGPEAAVLTALARYTVRTAAVTTRGTRRLLEVLNDALLAEAQEMSDDIFCTATYAGFAHMRDGNLRVEVGCGGHPGPLLLRADGTVEAVAAAGIALGLFDTPDLVVAKTVLGPGDMLIAYTDGITEARRADSAGGMELFGEERLRDVVAASAGLEAAGVAARLEQAAVDFCGGPPRDDIAVVVVRKLPDA